MAIMIGCQRKRLGFTARDGQFNHPLNPVHLLLVARVEFIRDRVAGLLVCCLLDRVAGTATGHRSPFRRNGTLQGWLWGELAWHTPGAIRRCSRGASRQTQTARSPVLGPTTTTTTTTTMTRQTKAAAAAERCCKLKTGFLFQPLFQTADQVVSITPWSVLSCCCMDFFLRKSMENIPIVSPAVCHIFFFHRHHLKLPSGRHWIQSEGEQRWKRCHRMRSTLQAVVFRHVSFFLLLRMRQIKIMPCTQLLDFKNFIRYLITKSRQKNQMFQPNFCCWKFEAQEVLQIQEISIGWLGAALCGFNMASHDRNYTSLKVPRLTCMSGVTLNSRHLFDERKQSLTGSSMHLCS